MSKIITTTTNTLEGWTIEEYNESISANVVVGSIVFSDFAAGDPIPMRGTRIKSYSEKESAKYEF